MLIFPFLTSTTQMTTSDLICRLTEVSVLIHKGSHTPDSCVPLKYLQLYGMIPCQDASKQGTWDFLHFYPPLIKASPCCKIIRF